MKINNTNYSYTKRQNPNFSGKVDKHFYSYLKDVQKDVLKTKGNNEIEQVEYAENAIRKIRERLNPFMAQTSKDIKLTLSAPLKDTSLNGTTHQEINFPVFLYKNTEVYPQSIGLKEKEDFYVLTKIDGTKINYFNVNPRVPHNAHDIGPLDRFSKLLVEKFTPQQLEKAVKEQAIVENEKKLLEKQEQLKQKEAENNFKNALKRLKNVFKH